MIAAVSAGRSRRNGDERAARPPVAPAAADNRTDGRRPDGESDLPTDRAPVPAGPAASGAPRSRVDESAPFATQMAAALLGDLGSGDRRTRRRPETVIPRARSAYGRMLRLTTELEAGFIVRRDV
jgi:hypothetical protein